MPCCLFATLRTCFLGWNCRMVSAEGVCSIWGHIPPANWAVVAVRTTRFCAWTPNRRWLLGESQGKFCLVTMMKTNRWLQHLTPRKVRTWVTLNFLVLGLIPLALPRVSGAPNAVTNDTSTAGRQEELPSVSPDEESVCFYWDEQPLP